jgi:DDE family transposase
MEPTVRPLMVVLREIPEVRKPQGLRHPLEAILALACAAMLCGYRSYSAIAEWGRSYDPALVRALGFTHDPTPCAATFSNVFRRLDRAELEARLGAWAETVLQATAPAEGTSLEAVALDGKSLRGSRKQGAPAAHLLSAVSHRLGLTLGQRAVPDKTNEIPVAPQLLAGLVLAGRVFTMDALLTQRAIAQTIVDGGGDYVMVAKDNQSQLEADIALSFATPPLPGRRSGRRPQPATWGTAVGRPDA